MTEQSSPTSQTPSAFYDPESSFWRTSQASLLSAVPESLERLPAWGTTSDGALFELRPPERLTAARDGSALLPTPTVQQGRNATSGRQPGSNHHSGTTLQDIPRLLIARLLPTPAASDCKTFGPGMDWKRRGEHQGSLPGIVMNMDFAQAKLLPTPTARDHKDTGDLKQTVPNDDSLLPRAIAHHVRGLTGSATRTPSSNGSDSSDDPPPTQQTTED